MAKSPSQPGADLVFPLHRAIFAGRSPKVVGKLGCYSTGDLGDRLIHRRQRGHRPIGAEHRGDERKQNNMASCGSHQFRILHY